MQNHHTIVKNDLGDWATRLGIPSGGSPPAVDDMPAMVLEYGMHNQNNKTPVTEQFHRIFREVVREFEVDPTRDLVTNKLDILDMHQGGYNRWGQNVGWGNDFGDKVRKVQEAWLRSKGYLQ